MDTMVLFYEESYYIRHNITPTTIKQDILFLTGKIDQLPNTRWMDKLQRIKGEEEQSHKRKRECCKILS